jgi:hypothetical protein
MPQMKEAKMKGHNGPSILCAVLLFGAVFVSPTFAAMDKVDDAELARANASVTGAVRPITVPDGGTFDKTVLVFSPSVSNAGEGFSLNTPNSGQEKWTYNLVTFNPNYWGGPITGVRSSR